ncbi:hypothetical protein GS506_12860 [Rhodococcus hoagii]|nr:hypothetical protein [Prescottella equi]
MGLGLLTRKNLTAIQDLLDRADHAEAAAQRAREGDAVVELAARIASGEVPVESLRTEAAKIPDQAHAVRVAEGVVERCICEAERIAYANTGRAADIINTELAAVSGDALDLAPALEGVTDAESAIAAGVAEQWQQVASLMARYDHLREITEKLRDAGRLPARDRSDEPGRWWGFRTPVDPQRVRGFSWHAGNPADAGRAGFLFDMTAHPYVPSTREEALAVRKQYEPASVKL